MRSKKGYRVIIILLLFIGGFATAQTPDPGIEGSHEVVKEFYNLGDELFESNNLDGKAEVKGTVHYPKDLAKGPFPMLLFLHGRHTTCYMEDSSQTKLKWPCSSNEKEIPSYEGYEYLAKFMASHGYIVVSIGANGISAVDNSRAERGMLARAELIQYHLDLWNNWNTKESDPFGNLFIGALDLQNIGTMGHSRGGEGVITHGVYNQSLGSPYGVKAVMTIGPTNFNRPILSNTTIASVLPYCDGDIADLGGIHYYDDARYKDPEDESAKHTILMMGANHNYYNTVWTPGLFDAGTGDDWQYVDYNNMDPHCGTKATDNKRFDAETQRAVLTSYASAFFRTYIGKEKQFTPILEVNDLIPPASSTISKEEIYVSYHAPSSKRLDINKIDNEDTETTNSLSGKVLQNDLANFNTCGDDLEELFCLNEEPMQEPHCRYYGKTKKLGLTQLQLEWDAKTDWYENEIPTEFKDFTKFKSIVFRASVDFKNSTKNTPVDFKVQLRDVNGDTHEELISNHSNALFYSPGETDRILPHAMHNSIKIGLVNYTNVDLSSIVAIRFVFDQSEAGAIIISDLMLNSPTDITAGVNKPDFMAKIQLFPNPTNHYLNIKGLNPNENYYVFNSLGTIVLSGKKHFIDVSAWSKGIYVLKSAKRKAKFVVR